MNTAPISPNPPTAAALALLEAAGLPTEDLTEDHMRHFFYSGPAEAPVALVGVEFCGAHALLRSLVVERGHRSCGLGGTLVRHAEQYARAHGADSIYALTTTAGDFFRHHGYVDAHRSEAPDEIRATREFSALCPAGSDFLVKHLRHG